MMYMIKKLFSTFFVLFALLSFPSLAGAQTPTERITYSCLNAQHCHKPVAGSDRCEVPETESFSGHRVQLTQSNSSLEQADTNSIYIVECFNLIVENQSRFICTTGDSPLDLTGGFVQPSNCTSNCRANKDFLAETIIYGKDNANADKPTLIFNTTGLSVTVINQNTNSRPFSVNSQGKLLINGDATSPTTFEWASATKQSYPRSFAIVTKSNSPSVSPTQQPATGGGLQQGDLSFISNCRVVAYDPLGYAYDINTGDPVPEINIEATYSSDQNGIFQSAVEGFEDNATFPPGTLPIRTNSSGFYSFFGRTGWYMMNLLDIPGSPNSRHLSRNEEPIIANNVSALYPKALNYYAGESFYEGPVLKTLHLPISIDSNVNPYQLSVLSLNTVAQGKFIQVDGQTSGPATITVNICEVNNGVKNCLPTPYKSLNPLNGGPRPSNYFRFKLTLDQSVLSPGQEFDFIVAKYELRGSMSSQQPPITRLFDYLLSKILPAVHAVSPNINFAIQPIPSYLEGYLYDKNGNVQANTKVGIYTEINQTPFAISETDSNGFFRIHTDKLPSIKYNIGFVNQETGTVEQISTTKLLAQNQEFLSSEKISLYQKVTQSNNPRADITPKFTPRPLANNNDQSSGTVQNFSPAPTQVGSDTVTDSTRNQMNIVFLIVSIVLLVAIAVGIFFYFKRMKVSQAIED